MQIHLDAGLKWFGGMMIVIVFCLASLPYISSRQASGTMNELKDVAAEERAYQHLLSVLTDAETSQRGFVITGDEAFLVLHDAAVARFPGALAQLERFATPDEAPQLQRIAGLAREKLAEIARIVRLKKSGSAGAAAGVASRHGKMLMDRLREQVGQRLVDLGEQRVALRDRLTTTLGYNTALGIAGSLLSMVVICAALFITANSLRQRAATATQAQALADTQAAIAREAEIRNQCLIVSAQMMQALDSVSAADELPDILPVFMQKLLPDSSGAVYLYRNSRDFLLRAAQWGALGKHDDMIKPSECWGLRLGSLHQSLSGKDLRCPHSRYPDAECDQICVPMMSQGELVGLFVVADSTQNTVLDRHTVLTIAEQLALAISNATLRDMLRQQSTIDPLTGLYNRRHFEDAAKRELARAERKRLPFAVMMVDLDYFKRVNDNYGHDAGDLVLREAARQLNQQIRRSDVACRYGGEELVLLLPECDADSAGKCAEDIRLAISQLKLNHAGVPIANISASFGVAAWPVHGADLATVLKAADRALYAAKEGGRNQVRIAGAGATPLARQTA